MADSTHGLHTAADLIAGTTTLQGMDVTKLSRDQVRDYMDARTAARNRAIAVLMGQLSQPTQSRGDIVGQQTGLGEWPVATEQSRGERVKAAGLTAVGFPISKFLRRSGWTKDYLAKATPLDLLQFSEAVMQGHLETNYKMALRALFNDTAWDWTDTLFPEDGTIKVMPLVNGDGTYIPQDWVGNTFDGTHTHYLDTGDGTFAEADLEAGANHIREHGYGVSTGVGGFGGVIVVWINSAQEAAARGHTNFVDANDPVIIDANKIIAGGIDRDQYIGYNSAARAYIRVVPWVPSGYVVYFATTTLADNAVNQWAPLRRRIPSQPALQGIKRFDETHYPLEESFWQDFFGFGVGNRITAAVQKVAASYTVPTIS